MIQRRSAWPLCKDDAQIQGEITRKNKHARVDERALKRKDQQRGRTLSDTYCEVFLNETLWYWDINRYTDKEDRSENPETEPRTHGNLVYVKFYI